MSRCSQDDYDDNYYIYDDGRFCDEGDVDEYQDDDDFGIPTYDELDLEGRYYNYGSRSDYNEWRYYKIQELKEQRRKDNYIKALRASKIPNQYNNIEIPSFDNLPNELKGKFASREEYNKWSNNILRKRKARNIKDTISMIYTVLSLILSLAIIIFIIYIISLIFF